MKDSSKSTDNAHPDTADNVRDFSESLLPRHRGFTLSVPRPNIGQPMNDDDARRYNVQHRAETKRIGYATLCNELGINLPPLTNQPGDTCELVLVLQLLSSTKYTHHGDNGLHTLLWLVEERLGLHGRRGRKPADIVLQTLERFRQALESGYPRRCDDVRNSLNQANGINVPGFHMRIPKLIEAVLDLVVPQREQEQFISKVQRVIACPPLQCNEHTPRTGLGNVKVFNAIDPDSQYDLPYAHVIGKPWDLIGGRAWHGPPDLLGGTCSQDHQLSDPAARMKEKLVQPGEKVVIFFDEDIDFNRDAAVAGNQEEVAKAQRCADICHSLSVTPHKWQLLGCKRRNAIDRSYNTANVRGSMFDTTHAAWYRLVAYALQNLPEPHANGRPATTNDLGYDHLVLRSWNPQTGRCFQVDSVNDLQGIECYELGHADFFRPGKALFALYERTSRPIRQGTVADYLTRDFEGRWPPSIQHEAGLRKTVYAPNDGEKSCFKAEDYDKEGEFDKYEVDPNQPGPSTL